MSLDTYLRSIKHTHVQFKDNILLSIHGDPLIADFGISYDTDDEFPIDLSDEEDGSVRGSIRWMPPEDFRESERSERSPYRDIWSLGMVFLVSGRYHSCYFYHILIKSCYTRRYSRDKFHTQDCVMKYKSLNR